MKRKFFRMRQSMSFALAMMMAVSNISGSVNVMAEGMEMDYSSVVEEEGQMEPFTLVLPYYEGCIYDFDEKHEFIPENTDLRDEKRDIILNYQRDEEVKLMIFPAEMLQITEMHLYDKDKKEPAFLWDYETEKLDFFMPETNLRLDMKLEERYPAMPEDSYYMEDVMPSTDWNADAYGGYDMYLK